MFSSFRRLKMYLVKNIMYTQSSNLKKNVVSNIRSIKTKMNYFKKCL